MSVSLVYALLVGLCVVIAVSQTMLKVAAQAYTSGGGLFQPAVLAPLLAGLILGAATQLSWAWLLQFVSLSRGYAIMALAFVFVPMAGWWWFGEPLTLRFLIGTAIVVSGLALIATS